MSKTKDSLMDILEDMHTALAVDLLKRIKDGTATAAELSVARQLLKDNKIEAQPKKGTPLGDLADLPVFDDMPDEPGDYAH